MHAKKMLLLSVAGLMLSSCGARQPQVELTAPQQVCPAFPAPPLAKPQEQPSMLEWLESLGSPS